MQGWHLVCARKKKDRFFLSSIEKTLLQDAGLALGVRKNDILATFIFFDYYFVLLLFYFFLFFFSCRMQGWHFVCASTTF